MRKGSKYLMCEECEASFINVIPVHRFRGQRCAGSPPEKGVDATMLFWLKETTVKRVLIEAPTRAAADAYSMGDECSDYMTSISGSSEAEIVLAGTHPREHGNAPPAPDVTVDAAGTVIEHERDRDDNDSK